MKKLSLIVLVLVLSVNAFSQKVSEKIQNEIKREIALESEYFYKRDFANWSARYLQNPKVYWSCIEESVILEARGWENLGKFVGDYMKANPQPLDVSIKRDTYKFEQYGKAVWVTFDEYQTTPAKTSAFRGTRILEKTKDGWKVVYMNSYPQPKF
jgi:SnoaL-like domain